MASTDTVAVAVSVSSSAAAEELIGARVVKSTQKGYLSCIRQIEEYFITHLHYAAFNVPVTLNDILGLWLAD